MNSSTTVLDPIAFHAYKELRKIAKEYDLEDELEVPQLVVVGETSAGKSMLIQNFLRFPCSFTSADIGTRCPVAYRLVHKSDLPPGQVKIVRPESVTEPSKLADHLQQVMEQIKNTVPTGFSQEPYQVEIESVDYTDFEILDVPGFVTGNRDKNTRDAVEGIVEVYVRNPRFSIVLLKEATQILHNATGALRIQELCTATHGKATSLPPRPDYAKYMITIQTKFDGLMLTKNGSSVNERIRSLCSEFGETYFVNMIFDGYSMSDQRFEDNVRYIAELPDLETRKVDSWIEEINQAAGSSTNNSQKFNGEYRSLIGVNVVRRQIQQLWLRSFRAALPRLKVVLQSRFNDVNEKYEDLLKAYNHQDPEKIRKTYLNYIETFQENVRQYAAYKSEILHYFPTEFCGKTYKEMEANCINSWKRYTPLTWRAYQSADQLLQSDVGNCLQLGSKLVGVRHFQRLNQIFHYLVFIYEPSDITDDGIQSAAGLLYGGVDDYENLRKAVREWVRKLIFDTFGVGIAWLAQMYIYILDTFRQDVKNYLLAPGKYNHIVNHMTFLYAVDRQYHKIVRQWIRKAILAVRYKCDSIGEYAHYDITARLKKLVFSIPATIKHQLFCQTVQDVPIQSGNTADKNDQPNIDDIFRLVPKQDILDHIYGSESYLTQDRNPQTLNHHENGRNVIKELYKASCGSIILEALSQFNSNVVSRIQVYGTTNQFYIAENKRSLQYKLSCMTTDQISDIANLQVDEIVKELENLEKQIGELFTAQKLVEHAAQAMILPSSSNQNESQHERDYRKAVSTGIAYAQRLKQKRTRTERTTNNRKTTRNRERFDSASSTENLTNAKSSDDEATDDENDLMNPTDEMILKLLMNQFYRRHDEQDLALGLPSKQSLRHDESVPALLSHLYIDPDTMDYAAATEQASAVMNQLRRTTNR